MPQTHAVVWIDHHSAQILHLNGGQVDAQKIKDHAHYTRQHGSAVRSEHEFFAELCTALAGVNEVLVTGAHTPQAAFRHYVDKHRAELAPHIVGWETVDHPTEGQLVALARQHFAKIDKMAGRRAPG